METNKVKQLHELGQSIWLDFLDRKFIGSGRLKQLIHQDGLRGMTSNPTIFEKAISSTMDTLKSAWKMTWIKLNKPWNS